MHESLTPEHVELHGPILEYIRTKVAEDTYNFYARIMKLMMDKAPAKRTTTSEGSGYRPSI